MRRAYFYAQAEPDTHVEVLVEDQTVGFKGVLGVKSKRGAERDTQRQRGKRRLEKGLGGLDMMFGASSPCVFHQKKVDGSGLVHGEDIVIATSLWHAKEIEKHLPDKWVVEVQTFGPGRVDSKKVRFANRNLTSKDRARTIKLTRKVRNCANQKRSRHVEQMQHWEMTFAWTDQTSRREMTETTSRTWQRT